MKKTYRDLMPCGWDETAAIAQARGRSKFMLSKQIPKSRAIDTRSNRAQKIKRSITLAKHA